MNNNRKTIGIVTEYWGNYNYGGLLQAYALQRAISQLGYSAFQVSYDYENEFPEYKRVSYKIKKAIKSVFCAYDNNHKRYEKQIRKFLLSIPHTKKVDSIRLNSLESEFDAYICGSDQIWNPIGWQPAFFLTFTNKAKISYAASIARDSLSQSEVEYISQNTQDFSALSVREKKNAEFLTKELGRKYELVPDPTLLLTEDDWNARFPCKNFTKRPYIFAYFLGFNEAQRNQCIQYANKKGYDIYFIPYMKKESYVWDKTNLSRCVFDYSVDNFIDLIRNAELVMTDSFHGTVFSCIFEKPFYVFNRQLIGNEKSMNSRMDTLFYEMSISSDRMINSISDIDKHEFSSDELENIRKAKIKWRKIGLDYLKKNLETV